MLLTSKFGKKWQKNNHLTTSGMVFDKHSMLFIRHKWFVNDIYQNKRFLIGNLSFLKRISEKTKDFLSIWHASIKKTIFQRDGVNGNLICFLIWDINISLSQHRNARYRLGSEGGRGFVDPPQVNFDPPSTTWMSCCSKWNRLATWN